MAKNEKLSFWILGYCHCRRWQWNENRHQYCRQGKGSALNASRVYHFFGSCAKCGYQLSLAPEEALAAIPAEEWNNSTIVGSCFYVEGEPQKICPDDVVGVVFSACNLDNRILPAGASMMAKGHEKSRGLPNCRNRIKKQNDLMDWQCKWADDSPVMPQDIKQRKIRGLSFDPKDLPEKELTLREQAAREALIAKREARRTKADFDGKEGYVDCSCLADFKKPKAFCPLCDGWGKVKSTDAKTTTTVQRVKLDLVACDCIGGCAKCDGLMIVAKPVPIITAAAEVTK